MVGVAGDVEDEDEDGVRMAITEAAPFLALLPSDPAELGPSPYRPVRSAGDHAGVVTTLRRHGPSAPVLGSTMPRLPPDRIRHVVAFTLSHEVGSAEEQSFLQALGALAGIQGVEAFEVLMEVSPKNGYRWAVSMEFAGRAAYDAYDSHPDHVAFVQGRWVPEVTDFLEVDLTAP